MARKQRRRIPDKTDDEIFGEIMTGFGEAMSFARGELEPGTYRVHLPKEIDVKAVRGKTGLSQQAFAGTYGFSSGTVRDWEQRRYTPDQAARAYLYVIGQKPDIVRETLAPLMPQKKAVEYYAARKSGRKKAVATGQTKRQAIHAAKRTSLKKPKPTAARAAVNAAGSRGSRSH